MKKCEQCGEMVDQAKAFCPGCGNPFVAEEKRENASEFDKYAGTVNITKSVYGMMLSEMELETKKAPPKEVPPPPPAAAAAPKTLAPDIPAITPAPVPQSKFDAKYIWIGIALAGLFILILLAAAGLFYLFFLYSRTG